MTKEIHDINTRALDFVVELIEYIFEYPDDDYMTMECLCRKLHKHGLVDKKNGFYLVADDTLRKTENSSGKPNNSTISKTEQVDEPTTQTETQNSNLTFEKADEPQTEQVGVPFGEMDEATFKSHCLNCQRDTADIKCLDCDGNKYFLPYGSKTDCAWK